MNRYLIFAGALLFASTALAQEAPESARRDLWCGLAFEYAAGEITSDAPERQQAVIPRYADGASMLIARAAAAYGRAGLNEAGFATRRAAVEAEIARQLAGSEPAAFSFEDCSELLEQ